MQSNPPNDAQVLALNAIAATLADQRLAERFLSLSGLAPPDLKQRAGDCSFLADFLRFLEGHEPDLLAIASAISVRPIEIVRARAALEG
ncbi:MAG TPA: DUF3572 family protein [Sphingomicrobium sp.]|nr:DUF3572 family protein [Sphingomicrobium sp.]